MSNRDGKVYLVGAGPGDPLLLTLRGQQCLERAEVVLYDYLANAEILRHAPPAAERICLGRHGSGRLMSQAEVNELMVRYASAGKTVVRLKGGDPGIFGRLTEEVRALRDAAIRFEVVPGITTAVAAGTYAGLTLTDRDQASCVAFVTGREQAGKGDDNSLDYAALAPFPGTLVFYMGVTTAPQWSEALLAHGKAPDTPVAIVRHCSLPTQQIWTCRLDEVVATLAPEIVRPPVVVIVGGVVQHQSLTEWFTQRPLFGQSVLVTRPAHQADATGDRLRELGARVLYQPAIKIGPPAEWGPVDRAIERLSEFDCLVFSSRNGVEYFLQRLRQSGRDWRALGHVKLAAIGPGTAEALTERDLNIDVQAEEFRAESLAEALAPMASRQRFLLLRASRGREVLASALNALGANVEQVVVYSSEDVTEPDDAIAGALDAGRINWVTVTSSSIARSLVNMFGDKLQGVKLVAISPLTEGVLRELGHPPAATAEVYTADGAIDAMLQHVCQVQYLLLRG